MGRAQCRAIQAELRPIDGEHVVDQDVGTIEQLVQTLAIFGGRQIERHSELAGVEINEHAAAFGVAPLLPKRAAKTDGVTVGRFDLDYFGAQQSEQFGCESGRHALTTIDYLYPGEHSGLRALITAHSRLTC